MKFLNKIKEKIKIDKIVLFPKTLNGKMIFFTVLVYIVFCGTLINSIIEKNKELELSKKTIEITKENIKQIEIKRIENKKTNFSIDYYKNLIDVYSKVNNFKINLTKNKSKYNKNMRIDLTFDNNKVLTNIELFDLLIAMSKLGYIETANNRLVVLHVENFTKDDAIKQIKAKRGTIDSIDVNNTKK
jgi:hypothetical protein